VKLTIRQPSLGFSLPESYADFAACQITPLKKRKIQIHGIELCSGPSMAEIKKHEVQQIQILGSSDSRKIYLDISCFNRTLKICKRQNEFRRVVNGCYSYILWWDQVTQEIGGVKNSNGEKI